MAKGTQYSKQFKEDAVRYRKDHPELTVQKAAENLGISESALKNWMCQKKNWRNVSEKTGSNSFRMKCTADMGLPRRKSRSRSIM